MGISLLLRPRHHMKAVVAMPWWWAVLLGCINLYVALPIMLLGLQIVIEYWYANNPGLWQYLSANHRLLTANSMGHANGINWMLPIALPEAPSLWLVCRTVVQAHLQGLTLQPTGTVIRGLLVMFSSIALAYVMFFMQALPLCVPPGRTKKVLLHVLKVSMLATGALYLWVPLLIVALYVMSQSERPISDGLIQVGLPLLLGLHLVTLRQVLEAGKAALPYFPSEPIQDAPLCETCGYNLSFTPRDSRCPECGIMVEQSLGALQRQPTAWEQTPNWWRLALVVRVLGGLAWHPVGYFMTVSAGSSAGAARRWLVGALLGLGLLASLIVPALFGWVLNTNEGLPWQRWEFWFSCLTFGIIWALLALMLVGIETLSVCVYAKVRKFSLHPVAANKLTAYASILMLVWVLLGGIQLLVMVWVYDTNLLIRWSPRWQFVAFMLSFMLTHIAGLFWFETIVYRGLRAMRYANR